MGFKTKTLFFLAGMFAALSAFAQSESGTAFYPNGITGTENGFLPKGALFEFAENNQQCAIYAWGDKERAFVFDKNILLFKPENIYDGFDSRYGIYTDPYAHGTRYFLDGGFCSLFYAEYVLNFENEEDLNNWLGKGKARRCVCLNDTGTFLLLKIESNKDAFFLLQDKRDIYIELIQVLLKNAPLKTACSKTAVAKANIPQDAFLKKFGGPLHTPISIFRISLWLLVFIILARLIFIIKAENYAFNAWRIILKKALIFSLKLLFAYSLIVFFFWLFYGLFVWSNGFGFFN